MATKEKLNERVFVGIPTFDGRIESGLNQAIEYSSRFGQRAAVAVVKNSVLTQCFNTLWCMALNAKRQHGLSHFAMVHADVIPEDWWLEKMCKIMEETSADVLSAVLPIKSSLGLTSIAIDNPENIWKPSRLTLKEIYSEFQETFTDDLLLINTGLMLVDLRADWVEEVCFRFDDDIILEDGKFKAVGISEDWYFSRAAVAHGAKLWATRAVKATHMGSVGFQNDQPWGMWDFDQTNGKFNAPPPEPSPAA